MPLETLPGLILPGHFTSIGTRTPPSQVRALLAAERRVAAVRPQHQLVAVVRGVDDDGVVGDAHVVELLEQRADLLVVLDHLGADDVFLAAAFVHRLLDVLLRRVRMDVDRRGVEPAEERLVLRHAVHPLERVAEHLGVEGLHALARQRAGVLDLLLADAAELRVGRRDRPRPWPRRAARRAAPSSCRYSGFFWPG